MLPDLRCLLAATLLLACSPDSERDASNGTSLTNVTSATTPGTLSAPGPTTGETADAMTGMTAGVTDTTSSVGTTGADPVTGGAAATGADPGETGVGTTNFDPPPTGDYAAKFIAGEQDHLSVRKASVEGDWCATITFVAPQEMGPLEYDVNLPATWRVKSALIHQGAADCLGFTGFPDEPIMAISGTGSASWAGPCPTSVTIDVTIAYPGTPPEVLLQADAVAVSGC